MASIAMILSGCGHLDGSEIREAVIALLELDRAGHVVTCFAPDVTQHDVINHLTGAAIHETRNVLVESARIMRGKIQPLTALTPTSFDGLILPGGFGAAKNLSDLAIRGEHMKVLPEVASVLGAFLQAGKPMAAICIAPAILVAAASEYGTSLAATIGEDKDRLLDKLGGTSMARSVTDIAVDEAHKVVSCPAYMYQAPLKDIAAGITALVARLSQMIQESP